MNEIDWRHMPSLAALRAFEATARALSFSAAARALNVTHAAVAQQVRALEEGVGAALVWREGRGLRLTAEGQRLAEALNAGFSEIAHAINALRAQAEGRPLRVTLPPTFATEWLMPRLAGFWRAHPNVPLALLPDPRMVDLRAEGAELGLRFGEGHWAGLEAEFLTAAPQIVVAAPELLGAFQGRPAELTLAQMSKMPWLREGDWPEQMALLASLGLKPAQLHFIDFPNEELALAAAREGIGLHLETAALVEADLEAGSLVQIREIRDEKLGYYIVRPPGPMSTAAQVFRDWLKSAV